jgi:isochorismate hydrolase
MAWAERRRLKESRSQESRELWRIRPPRFHPALIVTDMQNSFCAQGGSCEGFGSVFLELHEATLKKVKGSFGLVLTTEQILDRLHSTKHGASAFSLSMDYL